MTLRAKPVRTMFTAAYRKIHQEDVPEAIRYLEFLHCVEWYCQLTGLRFQATYLRLGAKYRFDWQTKPDRVQIIKAADYLRDERKAFLTKLSEFQRIRCQQKAQGHRTPTKDQMKELYRPDWV